MADAVITGRGLREAANADEENGEGETTPTADTVANPSSAAPA